MAKTHKKQIIETGRIIIVSPTHEDFLFQSKNPKEVYAKAQKDASNFDKMCRLEKDIRLSTYAECTSAFDKVAIILHIEQKDLEHLGSLSLVRQLKNDNGVFTQLVEPTFYPSCSSKWNRISFKKSGRSSSKYC